jgi:hypothetical protein
MVRLRRWLARKLDVHPDPGEGWCLRCSLNGGRTRVIPPDSVQVHAQEHLDTEGPHHLVDIVTKQKRL